jgi:hypothetical protein
MQSGNPRLLLMQGTGSNTQPYGLSPVSPTTARTWHIGPHTDPNWDEYHGDNFSYTMKCRATVEHNHCSDPSLYPQSVTWSKFTVNLQDVQIHPDTGTISPCYCECFNNDVILNHPIHLDVSTMGMLAFLAGFLHCSFDHTRQKYFELQFLA